MPPNIGEKYFTGRSGKKSAYENAGGRAQKFLKLTERHAAFTELTPAILNEFISRIEVHERDQKRARYAIQHISIYFNYIGKFENEVTQLAEPTEQEIRQMREEIEEAKKEKSRAYHRQYSREYRARNLEKQRESDRPIQRETTGSSAAICQRKQHYKFVEIIWICSFSCAILFSKAQNGRYKFVGEKI